MEVPQGTFHLKRLPANHDPSLRAWDAADLYALEHLHEHGVASAADAQATTVIVNDAFGALAVSLARLAPLTVSDSVLSQEATLANLIRNSVDPSAVTMMRPLDPLTGKVSIAVVKIPKSLAMLELQLARLAPCLNSESTVVGAAMSKHVHTSTIEAFERFVGATTTSLAKKKARLIFAQPSPEVVGTTEREQAAAPVQYQLEDGTQVASYPGVFSQRRLDQGTALLVKNIPHDVSGVIVDLGCGAGVLGVVAATRSSAAEVHFVDVSHLAIASARRTWQLSFGTEREADFSAALDLAAIRDASVQLVVNNPPFHADRAMGDATAWHMFADSKRVLALGGELFVVGNRHLGYHGKLKRLFGNCEVVATDPKFVVLKARRS